MNTFDELPPRWRNLLDQDDDSLATSLVIEPDRDMKSRPLGKNHRHVLSDQLILLEHDHVGRPLVTLSHAALIVLIRRELVLASALDRYYALWDHHCPLLLERLSLRWLVSAADTFADHGRTPADRSTGFAAALFANTIKLYETEYVYLVGGDMTEQDSDDLEPRFNLDGIIPFRVERGDTVGNLFKRKDRVIRDLGVPGQVLNEIMRRVNTLNTVYSRFRKMHKSTEHGW